MTIARGIALLACMVVCAGSCRETSQAKAEQQKALAGTRKQELSHRIAEADANQAAVTPLAMWILPPELREISGITVTADGLMLAHDDEVGRVFQIDPRTGIVLKRFILDGSPTGDFEGITTAGTDIYVLASNGRLFKFREGADGAQVPYSRYDTGLGKDCEFESLAYEPDSSRLLLACKKAASKGMKDQLVIYRVPLPLTASSRPSMLTIPLTQVIGSNRWKNFEPSDMAIDPNTGNYVLVASLQKGLAVIKPGGEVVRSEPLPGNHPQPEGVAITRDGILIISDEATDKPGVITLYRWRP